ncbi:LacI family transcriptional regulator [Streptomyces sp. A7024]|uniref:LacI family transcriptional regulator n=1 Tax=Streptomyces coryli TaxID=1128680 RepID=A0A6G4TUU0_9ACTN|nr:LacI family DNA-binding transcriptional regulator [Streptomyces coryli]NGN63583.1 LacI family transcriptional regulator [Streptomyces coryli]
MPSEPSRVTLATVAASAGVSVPTVSKVVNGRPDVSPATRARVQELLRRHDYGGYRDDFRGHPTIELFFGKGRLTAYSVEVIQGVIAAGARCGVAVVVGSQVSLDPSPAPADWAHGLVSAGRRAVVAMANTLTVEMIDALGRVRLPLVVIDPLSLTESTVPSVGSTNFAGGHAATQHLLSLGHRRIAYLGSYPDVACNLARLHGFRSAMEAAGVPVPAECVHHAGEFGYEQGISGGGTLLDLPDRPTAVFAASDELAAGLVEAARARGLRVPDDVSVAGFDDTQVAERCSPPLTTVHQPLQEMGAVALRTALRLASGEGIDSRHVELATRLVVRASTAPLP